MEVSDSNFPLGYMMSSSTSKYPERPKDERIEASKVKNDNPFENDASALRTHRKYKTEDTDYFFSRK